MLAGNWESYKDNDHADEILNRETERESIYADRLQGVDFVAEAQVEVHLVQVAKHLSERAHHNPVDDPLVAIVVRDDHESDENSPC